MYTNEIYEWLTEAKLEDTVGFDPNMINNFDDIAIDDSEIGELDPEQIILNRNNHTTVHHRNGMTTSPI